MFDPISSLPWPQALAALALGYLCGSVPFGFVVTRAAYHGNTRHVTGLGDVRKIGSGNIGATNVLRTGRKTLAAATLLGDALKGTAAVLLAAALWDHGGALLAGFAAFIGHLKPVWLKFKGGKGVSTYIGVLLGLAWPIVGVFAVAWLGTAALTRYSSLSALVASIATPIGLYFYGAYPEAALFALLTALMWWKHRENIARLRAGTEGKIGSRASAPPGRAP